MNTLERAAIAGAALYLIVLGVAMQTITYDIWGALVVVPVLVLISVPLVQRAFSGPLQSLRPYAWFGMFVKFAGGYAGYRVRFESYGGAADANRYHDTARLLAGAVRDGSASLTTVIPTGTKTLFIEQLTGLVYTIFGSSRLGGFMVFSWMSYWGLVLFVKAAALAVPHLAGRRYALLLFLFPSLVYWGSSIGKEAFLGLWLGASAYGFAVILTLPRHRLFGLLLSTASLLIISRIRVHLTVIWVGGVLIALVGRAVLDLTRRNELGRRQFRFSTIALTLVAVVGFVVVVTATLNYLAPAGEDDASTVAVTDRVTSIFDDVQDRTSEGGSTFTPISTSSPANWPMAAFRTLTRPLLFEARGLSGLLPALEMTALPGGCGRELAPTAEYPETAAEHALPGVRRDLRGHLRRGLRQRRQPRHPGPATVADLAAVPAVLVPATGAACGTRRRAGAAIRQHRSAVAALWPACPGPSS